MKRIIFLCFIICSYYSNSQILFDYGINYSKQIEIKPDSIFSYFEYPDLDSILFKSNPYRNFCLLTIIKADTNRRVKSINFYRIIEFSDTNISADTWNQIEQGIKKASREWIFKNLKWQNNVTNIELLEVINYMNESKLTRNKPFYNKGYYMLCFYYDKIFHHNNPITIFSTIRL